MDKDESSAQENILDDQTHLEEETVQIIQSKNQKFRMTIEPLLFVWFLTDSLCAMSFPKFILTRSCEVHFHFNKSVCSEIGKENMNGSDINTLVQPFAAEILTAINFLSVLIPSFLSLFLGSWSDYNGRKLLIIIPSLGYSIKYLLLTVFSYFPQLNPYFGLVVVIPVALTGGIVNFITASYSYISDISPEKNRFIRICILEAVIYAGTLVALLSTSFIFNIVTDHNYLFVFGLSSVVLFITTIITSIFIPESFQITQEGKGIFHLFEFKLLKDMFKVCFQRREGYRKAVIFMIIFSMTVSICISAGEENILFLFMNLRFGWNIKEYTIWNTIMIGCAFLGFILGNLILMKWLKLPDTHIAFLAHCLKGVTYFYFAFVPSTAPDLLYYIGIFQLFTPFNGPAGRAILCKSVPNNDIGKIFALLGSSEALLPLTVAPLFTWLYNSTIETFPSGFLILSGCMTIVCIVFYGIIIVIYKKYPATNYEELLNVNGETTK